MLISIFNKLTQCKIFKKKVQTIFIFRKSFGKLKKSPPPEKCYKVTIAKMLQNNIFSPKS